MLDSNIRMQTAIILSQLEEEYSTNLWKLFTSRFSTKEIFGFSNSSDINSTTYKWNYNDIYNRQDFNIDEFLKEYKENNIYVDWNALNNDSIKELVISQDELVKSSTLDMQQYKNVK